MPRGSDKLHVLVAGGGVAALEAMVALRKLAGELVDVELVSPDTDFFYRPLAVAQPFGLGEVLRFDPPLARARVWGTTQPGQRRRRPWGGQAGLDEPKRLVHL